ncbi:unnamed protein product [Mycena citricolor]|uniref:DUF6534 domain-containing protein n=2 Tax=Mycena citricolor TaxID=2018698 RepID=A0AAD2HHP1_9AGAR|nr:unnamed protein product [Mycena citricolor]
MATSVHAEAPLSALFVGVMLTTIFYGVTLYQASTYYRTYTNDPRHMKFIVALLLLLDTTQVSLAFASLYGYAISFHEDSAMLGDVSSPFIASMVVTSAIAFLVQLIYAYRIWRLSAGNAYLTTLVLALSFVSLGSSMAMTARTICNPRWDATRVNDLPAGMILASILSCDLLIAASQVWLFHRHRMKRGRLLAFFTLRRRSVSVSLVDGQARGSTSTEIPRPSVTSSPLDGRPSNESIPTKTGGIGAEAGTEDDVCQLGALLTTLTTLVINVGLLTSVDATFFFVLFLMCPQSGAFLVPYILLSNCYVNSFLSILNSRRILRDLAENPDLPESFVLDV